MSLYAYIQFAVPEAEQLDVGQMLHGQSVEGIYEEMA